MKPSLHLIMVIFFAHLFISPHLAEPMAAMMANNLSERLIGQNQSRVKRGTRELAYLSGAFAVLGGIFAIFAAFGRRKRDTSDVVTEVLRELNAVSGDREAVQRIYYSPRVQNNPLLRRAIRLDPNDEVECDADLCVHNGNGLASINLCNKYMCHCANGEPILQQCGSGTVFDPVHRVCNWAANLDYCL